MKTFVPNRSQFKSIQTCSLEILVECDRICRKYNINYSLAYGTLLGSIRHQGFIPWDDDIDICMPRKDYERFSEICASEFGDKYFYQSNKTDPDYFLEYAKVRKNGTVFKEIASYKKDIHQGVYIDIFPVDNIPDSEWIRKVQYWSLFFVRAGIQAKHIVLNSRKGVKFFTCLLIRLVYLFIPLTVLYKCGQKIITKYNSAATCRVSNLSGTDGGKTIYPMHVFEEYIEKDFEGFKFYIVKDFDMFLSLNYGDYMKLPPPEQRVSKHPIVELKLEK